MIDTGTRMQGLLVQCLLSGRHTGVYVYHVGIHPYFYDNEYAFYQKQGYN